MRVVEKTCTLLLGIRNKDIDASEKYGGSSKNTCSSN